MFCKPPPSDIFCEIVESNRRLKQGNQIVVFSLPLIGPTALRSDPLNKMTKSLFAPQQLSAAHPSKPRQACPPFAGSIRRAGVRRTKSLRCRPRRAGQCPRARPPFSFSFLLFWLEGGFGGIDSPKVHSALFSNTDSAPLLRFFLFLYTLV